MNVIDALNSRVTIRAFKPDPVSKEMILEILEAATRAPSSGNTQPWDLFVASRGALDRIRLAYAANFQHGIPSSSDLPHRRHVLLLYKSVWRNRGQNALNLWA
jgi:nitroreductase